MAAATPTGRPRTRWLPYRGWLLAAVLIALAASAIDPYDRRDWIVEHVPTLGALGFLVWCERRRGGRPLHDTTYTLLSLFFFLHVLGAYHLYSRVPYASWYEALVGSPWPWDTARNHYDRVVHLCFGVLVLPAIAEMARRITRSPGWAIAVGVAFVAALSKLYELAEWAVALMLSPEAAEAYNGQQGDIFDAQKDMALALLGSIVSGLIVACQWRRTRPRASAAD